MTNAGDSTGTAQAADTVHPVVRVAAEWTWRLLIIGAGLFALGHVVATLASVMIPFALALLLAGLLAPAVSLLARYRVPHGLSVMVVLVAAIGILAGGLTFIVRTFIAGLPELTAEITTTVNTVKSWITNGPLHLSDERISRAADQLNHALQENQARITEGAFSTATAIGEFLTGTFLTLFILIFLLLDGSSIWQFVTRLIPTAHRVHIRKAGSSAFVSLTGLMRATVAVALVDAIGIGLGLGILGVPLWLPLATLVFFGAFIPIVGALLAGAIAVLIALVTKGVITALIALAIIIVVMQIEGHVLQPLLLGRAVALHPLSVVLAIAVGMVLAGITGALFAVPTVAILNTGIRSLLASYPGEPDLDASVLPHAGAEGEAQLAKA